MKKKFKSQIIFKQFYILHCSGIFANYIHHVASETFDRPRHGNEGNTRAFKGRSIVPGFSNSRGRKGRFARSLGEEHLHQSRYTENLEIPFAGRTKRFHVSQFPMAVGRAYHGMLASVVNLLEYFCQTFSLLPAARML